MAKTTAPLLSFGASGQIAKTAVYGTWRGRPYVRRHVVPGNPKTAEQTKTRILFAWLNSVFKSAPVLFIDPWEAFAKGQAFLGRNSMIGKNVKILRGLTSIATMLFSPGARGGLSAVSVSAADGVGQSVVTLVPPALPVGWSILEAEAVALQEQDPQTQVLVSMSSGVDNSAPFDTITLTGLAVGTAVVGGWFKFLKPDSSIAYGPAINDTATIT